MVKWKKIFEVGIAVTNPIMYTAYKAAKAVTEDGRKELKEDFNNLVKTGEKAYGYVSDTADSISGKKSLDEAIARGKRLKREADNIRFRYESQTSSLNVKINTYVDAINASKKRIKHQLFRNLAEKLNTLKTYRIEDYPIEQHFSDIKSVSFESSSSTYVEPFTIPNIMVVALLNGAIGAIGALGILGNAIYNRYKANQINEELDKQECIINEAKAKCEAEIQRLRLIEASIAFIAVEFRNLEKIFERVVILIDEPIQYMKDNNIHKFNLLPEDLKKKFLAVMQIKDILKDVVERQIFRCESEYEIQQFKKEIQTLSSNACQNLKNANVVDFQYDYANDFSQNTCQSKSRKAKFVIREVQSRTYSEMLVSAEVISGSFHAGDKIILKLGKSEVGPYVIKRITQYQYNSFYIEIKNPISSISMSISKDWTGRRL